MSTPKPVDPASLDLAQLAYLVGLRANEEVLAALHADGFAGLRASHGFVFQHLLGGARTIGELATLLAMTPQGASKVVAELVALGYAELRPGADRRQKAVALSARGMASVKRARVLREKADRRVERRTGPKKLAAAKEALAAALELMGGSEAVRSRRVRPPSP